MLLVAAASVILGLTRPWDEGGGNGTAPTAGQSPAPPPVAPLAPAPVKPLPGGGTRLLPDRRVVALFGAPQEADLGALGRGTPAQDAARLERIAAGYRSGGRPVLPALWLIASISSETPGAGGLYRTLQPDREIRRYLAEARRRHMLLVLDLQPGRAGIMSEVRRLEPFLRQPDVGLALDPEWALAPDGTPADGPGSIPAATIAAVQRELARIVRRNGLPQKLLAVHRFAPERVPGAETLAPVPGVALVLDSNAIGPVTEKEDVYARLGSRRDGLFGGIKLFFEEDPALMTPRQVLALDPAPDVVIYE